ncbi:ShlB/FhaC/HecB family hemolysin secretion/activation protein [Agitococcus lubricus]|uniref:Hemolysin activation/secretion protein n=1 Tax=Agitococcus lubricus TaxID=1077255 RepID=A0A2T5IU28_9GAMM|nr:ShlB/FhaC/HecB family hemolysin secretion/activation protein [Agitococcus lubricus]PTQ87387.1 hemolysin activation/secretion protein [Agitococcus lubricus]
MYLRCLLVITTTITAGLTVPVYAEHSTTSIKNQQRPVRQLDLLEIIVDGNTVLSDSEIQEVLWPFLGLNKAPEDVDKAREALEKYYQKQGYKTVSVNIPKQFVKEGTVSLHVVEGKIRSVSVTGSQYHSLTRIKKQLSEFREGHVPNFNKVQEQIQQANSSADNVVTPSLKAVNTEPMPEDLLAKDKNQLGHKLANFIDVELAVEDKLPLHGLVELNNRYTQGTSEFRSAVNISYDNLWQRGHSISLFYQTAPKAPQEAGVIVANYSFKQLLAGKNVNFSLGGMRSNSNVSTLGGIEVIGGGHSYSAKASWPLDSINEKKSHAINIGIDYKSFASKVKLAGSSTTTPIRYYPLSLAYSSFSYDEQSSIQFDTSFTVALPQLGSDSSLIDQNRFGASRQMIYNRTSIAYNRDLANGWQLLAKTVGQISDRPLISNEQLSAGGMDTVRGYLESEAIGDYGLNTVLELRSKSLTEYLNEGSRLQALQDLRPFIFVDGASLYQHQPLPDSPRNVDLASVGFGLNINAFQYLNAVLDLSVPVVDGPTTHSGDKRILFRLWTAF